MNLLIKLRRGEGPFWGWLQNTARGTLQLHVPVGRYTKPFFRLLYQVHVLVRESLLWLLRFCWFEPLFRSQCAVVGAGLQMEKLPYLTGQGTLILGQGVRLSGKPSIGFSNRHRTLPVLRIGDHTFLGHDCSIQVAESVTIGRHCLVAGRVRIQDFDGHPLDADQRRAGRPTPPEGIRPVVIGDDGWLGADAIVLKGVTIGDRAVVGAGAVVVHDVPPDTVVAGNPARVVRHLRAEEACL